MRHAPAQISRHDFTRRLGYCANTAKDGTCQQPADDQADENSCNKGEQRCLPKRGCELLFDRSVPADQQTFIAPQ